MNTSTDQHDPQAFSLLAGRAGLNGWQWVFLLFGIITVALGVLSIFLIVDFPDKATFLTPEEKAYAMRRVEEDRGDSIPDEVTFKKILTHLADLKLWAFALCFMSSTTASCEPRCVSFLGKNSVANEYFDHLDAFSYVRNALRRIMPPSDAR